MNYEIDVSLPMKMADSKLFEEEYVHKFYNTYGKEFSGTRYKSWPQITEFISSIPSGSKVGDIGCGNGRHMDEIKECDLVGVDMSTTLLDICRKKGHNVF